MDTKNSNPVGLGTRNSMNHDPKDEYNIPSTSGNTTNFTPKIGSRFIQSPQTAPAAMSPIEDIAKPSTINRAMTFKAKEKSTEEKIYIILYKLNEND